MFYTRCIRPILFRSDPEWIHDRAISAAERISGLPWLCARVRRMFELNDSSLNLEVAGLSFQHPIGLAAGFDKSGRGIPLWEAFGFGHVEIGSVSAHFSAGNPKPRLFRVPRDRGIVVNYGLPNDGADRIAVRLSAVRPTLHAPLGVNIVNTNRGAGARPESNDDIIADYVASVERLEPYADYLCLNLSCPNTCDGRAFVSDQGRVRQLLSAVAALRPRKPVFLKIAPFAEECALDAFLETVDGVDFVRGFSINLPPGKPPGMTTPAAALQRMPGAVSGHPAEAAANRAIAQLYRRIDPRRYAIIGSGGVFTAEDAWRKIQFGASLVQCLTGLVYEGPGVVARIWEGLAGIMTREGVKKLRDAVGAESRQAELKFRAS
jgi:dihydroorotate dehydrogenase (fumarate)/dihydroorotate dehydrogenase